MAVGEDGGRGRMSQQVVSWDPDWTPSSTLRKEKHAEEIEERGCQTAKAHFRVPKTVSTE